MEFLDTLDWDESRMFSARRPNRTVGLLHERRIPGQLRRGLLTRLGEIVGVIIDGSAAHGSHRLVRGSSIRLLLSKRSLGTMLPGRST